jgi:Cu(I)/Ag(I) efflux system membrane protein CusA/SilA
MSKPSKTAALSDLLLRSCTTRSKTALCLPLRGTPSAVRRRAFALIGGFWLIYLLGHDMSIASGVGFIALAGVAAEFGVVVLIYLDQAIERFLAEGRLLNLDDLKQAISEGAVLRVRPKAMTVAVIIAGLLPIMFGGGTGSEVMQRIAAPMVGGMITAPLLSMFVIPAAYLLMQGRKVGAKNQPTLAGA